MSWHSHNLTRVFSTLLVGYILSASACRSMRNPQIINSYPLAINFDGLSLRQAPVQPVIDRQPQLAKPLVFDQNLHSSRQPSLPSDYQRRSNLPAQGFRQNEVSRSISSTESGSGYIKRTLLEDATTTNLPQSKFDYSDETNSTDSSTQAKLLLLRQKMIEMQGRVNVSIEDTNWRIAVGCLSNRFGPQFIRNRDVKCASSQIVLSISRLQRAGCKNCESYFYCEGFSNALRRCKDNYDVQDTMNVMRECQGLISRDQDMLDATRAPANGQDCQRTYLCERNCNYNRSDGTCPRNNCYQVRRDDNTQTYKAYLQNRRGRVANIAYPAGSPMKGKTIEKKNKK